MSMGLVAVSGLQALQQMRSYALWGFVMAAALGCGLLLPVWWWGWGLEGAAAALAGGHAVAGLGALAAAARRRAAPAVKVAAGPMLRYGATMFVFMGAAQLVHQVDKLMVGALRSAEEVGVYDVAALLSSHIPLFLMALNAVVFPKIGAAWHAGRKEEVAQLFALETRWVVMCSAPLFLALSLLRDPLMGLFGEGFGEGGAAIAVLSLAQLINASAGPVGGVLMMTDKERWVLFNTLLLGGLNAAGNALLIPRWGIVGASISTACALACWNLVALLQVWMFHRIQPYTRHYIAPLVVFGVACGVGFGLDAALPVGWGPWAATAASLLVYVGLVWRFGLQPEDRQLPEALLRRLRRA
jgi:O-antigen/teichoic acid export membrane protein